MAGGVARFLKGLALLLLVSLGCCCGLVFEFIDFGELGGVAGAFGAHDLGMVVVPEAAQVQSPQRYAWEAPALTPRRHEVGYELAEEWAEDVTRAHRAWARALNYERLEGDLMTFDGPEGCIAHLGCIYDALEEDSAPGVRPLAQRFVEDIRKRGLSAREGAELIVTFLQSLEYRLPEEEPFGVLPPALVLEEGWGDCDSKALLGVMMLEALGVDAVVLTSSVFKHAALGVALPGRDERFRSGGRTWQYVEVTASGWPIGKVPPEVDMPQFWEVVPRGGGDAF